jgi:branched-chain amino acid transport system substrate-binding protein
MTSSITSLFLIACLWVASATAENPVIVGAVVSTTGAQAAAAEGYRRALLLWEEEVNAAGGLLGRRVELRLRDDRSQGVRARSEYEKLVEEKADAFIGPYGSAATMMGAGVAERARRVMVNGGGPARTVHKRAPQYLFQTGVPYAAYGVGVIALARSAGLERLFILGRDDPRSRDMAEATAELARAQGFAGVEMLSYPGGSADFELQVKLARAAGAQAWIAFGEVREAADMVRTFKRLDYAPALFFARAAAEPAFVELLGQDAEFSLGAMEYDARLATPGNAAFAKAYAARWSESPGPSAAQGYAAATVLAAAVHKAGSLEPQKLRAALAALETDTVLGPYRVDPANGSQTGMQAAVAQILRGRPAVVWPRELETANALLPYPQWGERSLLK